MNNVMDSKKQKARLALILKTGKLRLWFFYPATRHYCYLSETGDYEREYNPAEFSRFFHPDDLNEMRSIIFDVCDGKQESGKVAIRSRAAKDADCRHYEVSISVTCRDDNGMPTTLMGIQHDVTDEYCRQQKIKQLLIRYHTIFNSSMLDMLYYDNKGVLKDINERACKAFGVKSREQVLDGSFLLENNPFYNKMALDEMENSHTGSIVNFDDYRDEEIYRVDELGLSGRMYYE